MWIARGASLIGVYLAQYYPSLHYHMLAKKTMKLLDKKWNECLSVIPPRFSSSSLKKRTYSVCHHGNTSQLKLASFPWLPKHPSHQGLHTIQYSIEMPLLSFTASNISWMILTSILSLTLYCDRHTIQLQYILRASLIYYTCSDLVYCSYVVCLTLLYVCIVVFTMYDCYCLCPNNNCLYEGIVSFSICSWLLVYREFIAACIKFDCWRNIIEPIPSIIIIILQTLLVFLWRSQK